MFSVTSFSNNSPEFHLDSLFLLSILSSSSNKTALPPVSSEHWRTGGDSRFCSSSFKSYVNSPLNVWIHIFQPVKGRLEEEHKISLGKQGSIKLIKLPDRKLHKKQYNNLFLRCPHHTFSKHFTFLSSIQNFIMFR